MISALLPAILTATLSAAPQRPLSQKTGRRSTASRVSPSRRALRHGHKARRSKRGGENRRIAPKRGAPSKRRIATKRRATAKRRRKGKRRARRRRRAQPRWNPYPPMPVYHIHSHELALIRLYDASGRLRPKALARLSHLMRDYKSGEEIQIHWRLAVLLYDLFIHFGQPQVTIFSGYRPHSTIHGRPSKHASGHAVDFALDGVDNREIAAYLLKHGFKVGVGYYPNSYHVHLDVRPTNGFWVDYSGPGEEALYSSHARIDFWSGRAKRGAMPTWAKRIREARRRRRRKLRKNTSDEPGEQHLSHKPPGKSRKETRSPEQAGAKDRKSKPGKAEAPSKNRVKASARLLAASSAKAPKTAAPQSTSEQPSPLSSRNHR